MKRLFMVIAVATLAAGAIAAPVGASSTSVQLIRRFPTVLAVRPPTSENFPVASLMRARCKWLYRVVQPNGSAIETQKCRLTDEPVMVPEFQGQVPDHRVQYLVGKCLWHSDYWGFAKGKDVMASWAQILVTPRGEVFITSKYPRRALDCPAEPT